jgi:hypothetical protein
MGHIWEREVKSPCFYYVWWALNINQYIIKPGSQTFQEYWRKSKIIGEKNTDLKRLIGRLKLRFLTEIGQFHWNQGEKVVS